MSDPREVALNKLYGRRAVARVGSTRVHAVRNDDHRRVKYARCDTRVAATVGQDRPVTCPACRRLLAAEAAEANAPYADRIAAAEAAIADAGYRLRYVDACEGAGTFGLLGMGLGVTMWAEREVRVRNMLVGELLADVLEHELAHVRQDPGFEQGSHGLFAD
jgi:hypothetical protein